jgi:osmotically-inducible protein OsmY
VETKKGIVRMSGPVDNILAMERAVEIARSTRGVRSVIDMIHLDAVKRGDKDIHRDVVDALERDPAVDHLDIDVKVVDGTATLTGAVDSFAEKYLAGRVIKGVKGVTEVKNSIQVEQKPERSDDEIKADIGGKLRDSVLIDHSLIKVQVRDGSVKLKGSVGSVHERLRAKGSANSVSGVKSVDVSELVVNRSQGDEMLHAGYKVAGSDASVRDAINDALLYDPRVEASQIHIEVVTPTTVVDPAMVKFVTLTGTVDNLTAKWAAEEDARNTIGVSLVKNHLTVPEGSAVNDSELMEKVEKALLSDPQLGSFSLKLSILHGKVFLGGTVSSDSDRQRAEEIVSRVKGVVAVQNDLEVVEQ